MGMSSPESPRGYPEPLEFELVAESRLDDGGAKRFGDVIHGSEFQPVCLVFLLGQGGDEDYRNGGRAHILLEAGADFIPRQAGHHDIQQDAVRPGVGLRQAQGFLPAFGCRDQVLVLEGLHKDMDVLGGVVHDEDFLPGHDIVSCRTRRLRGGVPVFEPPSMAPSVSNSSRASPRRSRASRAGPCVAA